MKSHTQVAIIGGGIMGVSLLYHLTKEGWSDVVLIEKGELTSGSTWHAAGQCPHFVGSYNLAKVHFHSTELYKQLIANGHALEKQPWEYFFHQSPKPMVNDKISKKILEEYLSLSELNSVNKKGLGYI